MDPHPGQSPSHPRSAPPRTSPQTCSLSWRLCSHHSLRTDPDEPTLPSAGALGAMRPHDTLRPDACSSGDGVPPWTAGRWWGRTASCMSLELCWMMLGRLQLHIKKPLCPSVCHHMAVPVARAGHGMGFSVPGPPHWLREWVWGRERMAELVKLLLYSRVGHGQGLWHRCGAALLGCRGWGPQHAAVGWLHSIWESNCGGGGLGETPPALGSVPWLGTGGHQHPPDPALGLSVSRASPAPHAGACETPTAQG